MPNQHVKRPNPSPPKSPKTTDLQTPQITYHNPLPVLEKEQKNSNSFVHSERAQFRLGFDVKSCPTRYAFLRKSQNDARSISARAEIRSSLVPRGGGKETGTGPVPRSAWGNYPLLVRTERSIWDGCCCFFVFSWETRVVSTLIPWNDLPLGWDW